MIDNIGQPDPQGGPGDPDGSDKEIGLRLLIGEDMLDSGSDH